MRLILWFYKSALSPFLTLNWGHGCVMRPTCGQYTFEAVRKYGLLKGGFLGLKRLSRCHPWAEVQYDPLV